ncbi:MAG: hypothetical protein ACD_76C00105G0005 [uncultured bacterium]|nr:MAG: hypothetical protein ACD_76C00105G0005 [uncultured bacterium]HBD04991.1 transcription elongation factor GreA [Candidatus Uhrbacteria bacterium]
MTEQVYMSSQKLEEIKLELIDRKSKIRKEIAERIANAKELGDLSENFEYHEAKEAQGMNEMRVAEIEAMIKNAVIVEEKTGGGAISIGASFTAKINGDTKHFSIVGPHEADPLVGKISNESPIGRAFLGTKTGDKVEVDTPSGKVVYEIQKVD